MLFVQLRIAVQKASIEYAAICIKRLRTLNLELAHEIEALDELIEQLKDNKRQH
jgi:hypothetical protein